MRQRVRAKRGPITVSTPRPQTVETPRSTCIRKRSGDLACIFDEELRGGTCRAIFQRNDTGVEGAQPQIDRQRLL